MAWAIVIVFPDPVTPSRVWNRSPRSSPAVSSAMALGWSPAGSNGAWRRNGARAIRSIYRCFFGPANPSDGGHGGGRRARGRQGDPEVSMARLRLHVDVAALLEHQSPD